MKVKLILPALVEAAAPGFGANERLRRPIKYSLFPPLGLAQLAAFLDPDDEVTLVDEHVEPLTLDDEPDLVAIEVYSTNARRAYSILKGDTIERAAEAGLRSLFVGFETLGANALQAAGKVQNLGRDYDRVVRRLDDLGVLINGSFVFGLDGDGPDVFDRTLDFARSRGITTATFHIATPYPGTVLFEQMERQGRLLHRDYDLYDTRHVVFAPRGMTPAALEAGYYRAYREFYSLASITEAARAHVSLSRSVKHFVYAVGWKRFEKLWDLAIRAQSMKTVRPVLEAVLATVRPRSTAPERGGERPVVRELSEDRRVHRRLQMASALAESA